ncbi:MAG: DNA polymerase III subunit gamma/tau, partial [Desulfuromonadales bacterium]|nr:DNA polymerase III subunit gamma/tau [Desulfuromonadales bacterium]
DPGQLLVLVQKVDDHGHSFRQFCQQLVELVRALVVLKVVDQPGELIDVGETELQELRSLSKSASLEDLQRLLSILIRAEADLAVSNYPRLTMEMVLVKLAELPAAIDVATLVQRLLALEQQLADGLPAAPVMAPVKAAAPAPPADIPLPEEPKTVVVEVPVVGTSGDRNWFGLVEFVKARRKHGISSLLEQSSLLLLELPRVRIGMPVRYFGLVDNEKRQTIQALAAEYFGADVNIEIEKIGNGDKAPPSLHEERAQQESDRQKKLRENAIEHPLVKSAVEIFGGKITTVKPIDKGFV